LEKIVGISLLRDGRVSFGFDESIDIVYLGSSNELKLEVILNSWDLSNERSTITAILPGNKRRDQIASGYGRSNDATGKL